MYVCMCVCERVNGKTKDVHFDLRVEKSEFMKKKKNFTNFNTVKMSRK